MGQSGRADHERQRVGKHVQFAAHRTGGVFAEAEVFDDLIQLGQQRSAIGQFAAEAQLRDGVAGELE